MKLEGLNMEFNSLIEKIVISNDNKKRKSLFFWLIYLKKSWLLYCILFLFTSIFIALYIISKISFLFYALIIYPIVLFVALVCEGVIRNYLYLKKSNLTSTEIYICKDDIKVLNEIEGYKYISEFSYNNILNINNIDGQIIFEIKKNRFLKIPEEKLSNTTYEFLVDVIQKKEEC